MQKIRSFINSYWILILLLIIKLVLQYIAINPYYELHRDEFLYLNQADHLAFGYISVPPFTALVSKIIYLFGGGLFWVKFFPALFGMLTIVFTWLIVESLGGSTISKIIASSALLFSVLVRLNILLQPNSFDILAWTATFYLLLRFIQTEKSRWLYFLAILIAAGFYNKYNMIFLVVSLALGFLFTSQRRIFNNRSFWKAMIICLLLMSPNIIWQIRNHFPVFEHMKVLKVNQLDNNSAGGFLRSQVMFFFGSLPLTLASLIAFFFIRYFKPYRFIGITFICVMVLFASMKAKDYYAAGIFPVMIAFGCLFFDRVLTKKWKFGIFPALACLNIAIFFLVFKLLFPVLSPEMIRQNAASFEKFGMLRWEDGKNHDLPQDFADMTGWKEMADKSLIAFKMIPDDQLENSIIICGNYGEAGALNYYERGKMPEAYAFNTDYIFWMPQLKKINNAVIVGEKPSDEIISLFNDYKLVGSVGNIYAREHGAGIYLFTGAKDIFTTLFYKKVEERKSKMDFF